MVLAAQRGDMDLAKAICALAPRQMGQPVEVDQAEWGRMLAVLPEAERAWWGRLGGALCIWGDPVTLAAVEVLLRRRTAH